MKFSNGLAILGFGRGRRDDTKAWLTNAEFRKATVKMQLASLAMDAAIAKLDETSKLIFEDRHAVGFILNSGYGELEATTGFLKTLAESGVARPLLFQNSLHNSTTGFCAIRYGLVGAVVTLNHRVYGGEQSLQTAETLIRDDECRICIVTTVETIPPEFSKLDGRGVEGASTVIVADAAWAASAGLKSYGRIEEVSCHEKPALNEHRSEFVFASLYEFDAVRAIARNLEDGRPVQKEWTIEKPFAGFSVVHWS